MDSDFEKIEAKMNKIHKLLQDSFPKKYVSIEFEHGEMFWEVRENDQVISEKKFKN